MVVDYDVDDKGVIDICGICCLIDTKDYNILLPLGTNTLKKHLRPKYHQFSK